MDAAGLRKLLRVVPDYPKAGVNFLDISPVLADAAALDALLQHFAAAHAGLAVDKVVALDARGFLFAGAVARAHGAGVVLARKAGKLPHREAIVSRDYATEYSTATFELQRSEIAAGDRVLLVDDVLATGGSLRAVVDLVEECGAVVAGVTVMMDVPPLREVAKAKIGDVGKLVVLM